MKKTLLSLVIGAVLGASAIFAWNHYSTPETDPAAAEAQAEINRLKNDLLAARQASDSLRSQIASAGMNTDPVKPNELDINRLLNDARPLMKSLAIMFDEQRKHMTERMIRGLAERLAMEMGLTPEQTDAMIAHFLKLDAENFEKIKGNPNLTVIGHMTDTNSGYALIDKHGGQHELRAQGWDAFLRKG